MLEILFLLANIAALTRERSADQGIMQGNCVDAALRGVYSLEGIVSNKCQYRESYRDTILEPVVCMVSKYSFYCDVYMSVELSPGDHLPIQLSSLNTMPRNRTETAI